MIYIENIYICLAAPLILACFCLPQNKNKALIFELIGATCCLLSAYINVFFAQAYSTDIVIATVEIAPVIEEVMKLLPILFYLIIFCPQKRDTITAMLWVAIGFATFENICYLMEYGSENLTFLLMRGFGTGAMHIVCGAIVGYGLLFTWHEKWLKIVGTLGVMSISIVFHGQYNLLMSSNELGQMLGAFLPITGIIAIMIGRKRLLKNE